MHAFDPDLLSAAGGILFLAGYVPYILDVLGKRTQPAKVTWLVWAALNLVTLGGILESGAFNWQIVGAAIGSSVVAILALRYGAPGWSPADKLCLGGCILGFALWRLSGDPRVGIAISLATSTLGAIPMVAASWKDPSRESRLAWTIFWISCLVSVAAIRGWTFAHVAQPVTFLAVQSVMMYIVYVRAHAVARYRVATA